MSSPRKTFMDLDKDDDESVCTTYDSDEDIGPPDQASSAPTTQLTGSGDTTLVNTSDEVSFDKTESDYMDESSGDEPECQDQSTQQPASPLQSSFLRRLNLRREISPEVEYSPSPTRLTLRRDITPQTRYSPSPSRPSPPAVSRSNSPDYMEDASNWNVMVPAPTATQQKVQKRKLSIEDDSLPEGIRAVDFATLPTVKKIKYSDQFIKKLQSQPKSVQNQPVMMDNVERGSPARISSPLPDIRGPAAHITTKENVLEGAVGEGHPSSPQRILFPTILPPLKSQRTPESPQTSPVKKSQAIVNSGLGASTSNMLSPPSSAPAVVSGPAAVHVPVYIPSGRIPVTPREKAATVYLAGIGLTYQPCINGVVCSCGVWVEVQNIIGHLTQTHARKREEITHVDQAMSALGIQKGTARIPQNLDIVPGLPLYQAFQCGVPGCTVIMKAKESMRVHTSKAHKSPADKKIPWEPCHAQQLNRSDAKSFFRVFPPSPPEANPTAVAVALIIADINQKRVETSSRLADNDNRLVSPWLLVTKWPEILGDRTTREARDLVDDGKDIPYLTQDLWELMLRCTNLISITPQLVLERLNTSRLDRWNNTPFHRHQNHLVTLRSYIAPVIRLLAYLIRASDEQTRPLRDMLNSHQVMLYRIEGKEDRTEAVDSLYHILSYCWSREWLPTEDDFHPDPTLRSLAYGHLHYDGTWSSAKDTTGDIAKFFYVMRLINLYTIHQSKSISLRKACKIQSHWFTEKKESTFNSLQSHQHFATAAAYATIAAPFIVWLERGLRTVMSYRGDAIDFADVIAMFASQSIELVRQFETHVTLGLATTFVIQPMENISDDLNNHRAGYSFITDRRNTYYRHKTTMLTAVLDNPELSSRFIHGFDHVTGKPMWNPIAIRSYLKQVATFCGLLLLRCVMVSGAPIRGTEATSMAICNTGTCRRNFVMFGKHLMMLNQYSKMSSVTQRDRLIGRCVDAGTSDILVNYLTFVQPFVTLLATECFPSQVYPGVYDMYENFLFIDYDSLFTTDTLSDLMKEETLRHLGVPLSISDWRHVAIAFQQTLCRSELAAVDHIDEGERVAAEQAGHSHTVENRMYAISTDTVDGTPSRNLYLFCDISVAYQTAAYVVPSGVRLPYRQCLPDRFENLVAQGVIAARKDPNLKQEELLAASVVDTLKPYLKEQFDFICGQLTSYREELSFYHTKYPDDRPWISHSSSSHLGHSKSVEHAERTLISHPGVSESNEDELEYVDNPLIDPSNQQMDDEPLEYVDNPRDTSLNNEDSSSSFQPAPITTKVSQGIKLYEPIRAPSHDIDTPRNVSKGSASSAQYSLASRDTQRQQNPVYGSISSSTTPHTPLDPGDWFGNTEPHIPQCVKINIMPTLDTSDALVLLKQVLHDVDTQWSSQVQRWAVSHVMEGKHDVLVVAPTGSGKTMIWVLNILLNRVRGVVGIYVVVLPLISLLEDHERRLKELGVPFHVYSPSDTGATGLSPNVEVILTTVNQAVTDKFRTAMQTIHLKTPILRIVQDEAHFAITSPDFRDEFLVVEKTRCVPSPLLVMSATIPPHLEAVIKQKYQLSKPYVSIRGVTDRSGIIYNVLERSDSLEDLCFRAEKIVQEALSKCKTRDRVLVFVASKKIGERLAVALSCNFYFSGNKPNGDSGPTPAQRSTMHKIWTTGGRKVLVATNALGAGGDYKFTRLVLHVGTPSSMIDFIQETGRAGRDHLPAQSIVIPWMSTAWLLRKDPRDYQGVKPMMEYVAGGFCRRSMLNKFNDGESMSCKDIPDAQICDYCTLVQSSHKQRTLPSLPDFAPTSSQPKQLTFPVSQERHSFTQPTLGADVQSNLSSYKQRSLPPSVLPDVSRTHSQPNPHTFPVSQDRHPIPQPDMDQNETVQQVYDRVRKESQIPRLPWISRLKDATDVLAGACMLCTTVDKHVPYHGINDCPQLMKDRPNSQYPTEKAHYLGTWREALQYGRRKSSRNTVCYKCHFPNGPDDSIHPAYGKDPCPYPDLIALAGYRVLTTQDLLSAARTHFGQTWRSIPEFAAWATQETSAYPTNLVTLFVWFYSHYF